MLGAITTEPPTYLIVALDGLTDEINSVFRKGAKLEGALEGVRKIAAIKEQNKTQFPILHMRFIVMNHNQHQVPQLEEYARENHFDFLTIRTLSIIDSDRPDENHRQMIPDETAYCAYNYQAESRVEKKDFICMEPFWFPSVFADGTVVPCEQDYKAQLPMGKISSGNSFRDIWYSSKAQDVRSRIRDQADSLSFCRNCPYRDRDTTDVSIKGMSLNQMILPVTSNES